MGDDKEILILECNGNSSEDAESISQYGLQIFRVGRMSSPSAGGYRARRKIRKVQGTRHSTFHRVLTVHGKPLLATLLTMISSTACFIFFPIYLEMLTDKNDQISMSSDGYSACFVLTTCTSAIFLIIAMCLQTIQWFSNPCRHTCIFLPEVPRTNIIKIGVSTAICLLTVCYAWADHKVFCNQQLPLLGFVFVFASITHALSRWKELGFRRSFAILAVISGVFISVDFTLINNERCRGRHPVPKDRWTWKVHLVWTLAFVVGIWLWTVVIFSMVSAIPLPQRRQETGRKWKEEGVRMKSLGASTNQSPVPMRMNSEPVISDHIYVRVPLRSIFKGLLSLNISTWIVVLSLFWTEFVPGLHQMAGLRDHFSILRVLENGFMISFSSYPFWILLISAFIFAHAFAYLLVSSGSPLIAIGVMCVGFPSVAFWWSMFQIRSPSPFLIWMPVVTEIISALLGYPLIIGGTFYLFSLDVLGRSKIRSVVSLN